ncbi:MAG: hypothetical protein HRT67_13935 [Flavobacteriaceae bacterium]|nr:hypothetical protein [Flavobacteriaceae bacterium]
MSNDDQTIGNEPTEDTTNPETGISTTIPSNLGSVYSAANNFNRYTKLSAPNGVSIHIVSQNNLTDEQIIRCRSK